MGVRQVPFMNLYDTYTDLTVIADDTLKPGIGKTEINPAFFRPEMTVADFSRLPLETEFSQEAVERGCRVIPPQELGYDYLAAMFKAVSGKELDREIFDETIQTITV